MNRFLFILFLLVLGPLMAQESSNSEEKDNTKIKVFFSFDGKRSFLKNDTRYFGFDFGLKAKCKYKFGFGYSWLRGTYKTDAFPVNQMEYPNAQEDTRTDAKFYSVMFEPIVFRQKKVNISVPIHVGITELTSEYRTSSVSFEEYHLSRPMFGDISANFDFRVLGFMKLGFSLGYRFVATDLDVAAEALNTPLVGFNVKLGGMCK